MLPEIQQPPRILSNYMAILASVPGLRERLDQFLGSGSPSTFPAELHSKVCAQPVGRLFLPGHVLTMGVDGCRGPICAASAPSS